MVFPVRQHFCLKIDHGKAEGDTERTAFWRYRIISDECDSYSEYNFKNTLHICLPTFRLNDRSEMYIEREGIYVK